MKKRMLSIVLILCMVLMFMPITAFAGGTETNPAELTASDITWSTGWYIAEDTLTIPQRVTVSGNVNLILADGCNLTVSGGIRVEGSNSLTIYGQESGNGILSATCTGGDAGIGGNKGNLGDGGNGGTITINGGIITASGTNGGAGIGGGSKGNTYAVGGSGGNITINGGTVMATGAWNSGSGGAGIGGGYGGGSGGTILINGGTVTATADSGAGIGGGGNGGAGGNITISGGTVNATGGNNGAGIGGGSFGDGGTITIRGGVVEANGSNDSAGIGGGCAGNSGSFKTDNGNAVIFASKGRIATFHISDTSGKDNSLWSGVIFEGDSGKVYGESVAPSEDFTIPAGKTLTIESGHALVIKQGVTLTNNGNINNSGKIYVDGTFTGTADNLYYPLTLVHATASENTSEYNSKNYGKAGSEITLTPDVLTGYEFTEWSVSPSNAITINSNSKFTMQNRAITVTAQYKDIAEPAISGIEDGKTYCSAQTVTVLDNDAIEKVTVNGTEVTLDEHNQFTLSPASGEQKIIATDNARNSTTVTVTVNDGHTYGEWQSNGDGTHTRKCTIHGCNGFEDGDCAGGTATCVDKAICDTCKTEYGELDSANHDLENTPAKAATDTETGNIEYWHCKDCGKYFSDQDGKKSIALADTIIPVNAWGKTVLRFQGTASKTSIKMTWKEVPEADGYVIYWNKCGSKKAFKPVKEIKSGKTLTWTQKNLKKSSNYKYYVKAYKVIDGKKCFIKTSSLIHLATKGGKYTNVKKLKSSVSSVTLKQGKTKKLKIKQTYVENNKKLVKHMRSLTYTTSDKKVATVTSKGVIKAKGKGSCYIYITARSGVYTRVKVTVK